ncbi:hypothetical protein [Amycolatopsis aidingensis]|uniref:hypothetical protein n=1 Tax=Amycolatopsis aidingensis TaxID=2842453 RepID=UPI001C0DBA32|nr:hypothetical protein [Amycolatopsis aidingensis]
MLEARHHARIEPARPDLRQVSASIGPAGELLAVWAAEPDLAALTARVQRGGGSFAVTRTPHPVSVAVTTYGPGMAATVSVPDLRLTFVTPQPLPDGQVLLVGGRAGLGPAGADHNAVVYDAEGLVLAEDTLGDGIEHVLTTSTGDIWVGYFDEGVYGNHGWGAPGGRPPVGESGLVRFSADLRPQWWFPAPERHEWDPISDCYALNVTEDAVWTCYYTGFPVIRVREGVLTGWPNEVAGAKALLVGDSRIVLYGGYRMNGNGDRLVSCVLDGERVRPVGEYRLTLPGGRPVPAEAEVVGRGRDLHLITEGDWYRIDLDQIPPNGGAPPRGEPE